MIYLSINDNDGVSVATALSNLRTLVASSTAGTMGQLCVHMDNAMKHFIITVQVSKHGILEESYDIWQCQEVSTQATD